MGAPLLLGLGDGENFAASDTSALLQVTRAHGLPRGRRLRRGDAAGACASSTRAATGGAAGAREPAHRRRRGARRLPALHAEGDLRAAGGRRRHARDRSPTRAASSRSCSAREAEAVFASVEQVLILACGTSYHAGLVARYWLESLAGIPCNVEIASEYRYRDSVPNPRTLVVAISQSGETADTLAALQPRALAGPAERARHLQRARIRVWCAPGLQFLTRAGPEIGVASTKAFTTQLAALLLLALTLAKVRGRLAAEREARAARRAAPPAGGAARTCCAASRRSRHWAAHFAAREHALFLGRGMHYPIAMEGALKLKEISYIHAEAYAGRRAEARPARAGRRATCRWSRSRRATRCWRSSSRTCRKCARAAASCTCSPTGRRPRGPATACT